MIIYLLAMYAVSLFLGYVLALNGATLAIGKSISNTDSPRGFQDAITPPWSTNLAIIAYIASFGGVVYGYYKFGWFVGIGITVGFFIVVALNKVVLLPKNDSNHFRQLIINSMINRYADYVKAGDELRASAMGTLLEKLGIPVSELRRE